MKRKILKVGTRASPLALAQTEIVRKKLSQAFDFIDIEAVPIKTTGDKIQDRTLAKVGGKGLFTKEIEEALLKGDIHIAVHSMKDMPTQYPDGLSIPCVLERENPLDVLIYKDKLSLQDLPSGLVVGTSSLRRGAQILYARPDLEITSIRGNVQTRLRKLGEGHADATIMAKAGLIRLGLEDVISHTFSFDEMLPAVAQGAIGVECREDDIETLELLRSINHEETFLCLQAERAFLRHLDGSCQTPIGGYGEIQGDQISLRGFAGQPDGTQAHKDHLKGPIENPEQLGLSLAEKFLDHMGQDFFKRDDNHGA